MKEKGGRGRTAKNMRIRRGAENVILVCLAALMLFSGWKIVTILRDYNRNQASYEEIAEQVEESSGGIDFGALSRINPDIIGWLRYEGTQIDYPVVQGSDNDKYLTTMFDGKYGSFGTLFADAGTIEPFRQFNTIIYGHHMRNGSMFGELEKLKDASFCREHPQMELITPDGEYSLEIWAFLNQPSDSLIYSINLSDEEECAQYLETVRETAEYTTDVSVDTDDRLVVLSTCAYEYKNARYIAVCRMRDAS